MFGEEAVFLPGWKQYCGRVGNAPESEGAAGAAHRRRELILEVLARGATVRGHAAASHRHPQAVCVSELSTESSGGSGGSCDALVS